MRRRLTCKIYTGSLMFGLLMVSATTADCDSEKSLLQYSPRLVAGQWNPWTLPEVPEKSMALQCPSDWQNEQTQGKSMDAQGRVQTPEFKKRLSGRFVTPGILESLKQQQIQTQMTPYNEPYNQSNTRQRRSRQQVNRLPEKSYYGEPTYNMGTTNPLYDTPAVSPWGSGPDVVYRGGSFSGALPDSSPWVPNEAVGGLLPMPVSPFEGNSNEDKLNSMNSDNAETDKIERRRDNNVFNPFTFIPNRSWR